MPQTLLTLQQIDFKSPGDTLIPAPLRESVATRGLIQPVLLYKQTNGAYIVVDGVKRLHIWQQLFGREKPFAAKLTEQPSSELEALFLRLHLRSASYQGLVNLELVQISKLLQQTANPEEQAENLLSALGRPFDRQLFDQVLALSKLPASLASELIKKRLPLQVAALAGELPHTLLEALSTCSAIAKLSSSEWRQLINLLYELCRLQDKRQLLEELIAKTDGHHHLLNQLEMLRYPQKTEIERQATDTWQSFELSKRIKLERSTKRETAKQLNVQFQSLKELEELIEKLHRQLTQQRFRDYINEL